MFQHQDAIFTGLITNKGLFVQYVLQLSVALTFIIIIKNLKKLQF